MRALRDFSFFLCAVRGFYFGMAFITGHDAVYVGMGKERAAESFTGKAIVIG